MISGGNAVAKPFPLYHRRLFLLMLSIPPVEPGGFLLLKLQVMTTGIAGGLRQPYKGLVLASVSRRTEMLSLASSALQPVKRAVSILLLDCTLRQNSLLFGRPPSTFLYLRLANLLLQWFWEVSFFSISITFLHHRHSRWYSFHNQEAANCSGPPLSF